MRVSSTSARLALTCLLSTAISTAAVYKPAPQPRVRTVDLVVGETWEREFRRYRLDPVNFVIDDESVFSLAETRVLRKQESKSGVRDRTDGTWVFRANAVGETRLVIRRGRPSRQREEVFTVRVSGSEAAGTAVGLPSGEREIASEQCRGAEARVVRLRDGETTIFADAHGAVAELADGDLLWFCPGRHVSREKLRFEGRRGLRLAGDGASIVSKADAAVLSFDDCEGVLVDGLHVVHEIGSWCAENTLEFSSCRGVVVSNCDLDGSGYFGLGLSRCEGVLVENNVVRNSHAGLANWASSRLQVRGNTFRDNDNHFLSPPPEAWLSENTLGRQGRRESVDLSSRTPPSFDCAKASSVTEITICNHPSLRVADARMASLYEVVRGELPRSARMELQDDQRAWLKARSGCADDVLCLGRLYDTRIDALLDALVESGRR